MAFPSTPTIGDIYSESSFSWRWDGVAWSAYGSLQNALQRYNLTLNTNLAETTVSTSSPTAIDAFDKSQYSTVEYTIQMKQGTSYRSSKVLLINNGTSVSSTEYAILNAGTSIPATVSVSISGSDVIVSATITTAGSSSVEVKAYRIAVTS